jgi:hypothetical protein
VAVAVEDAARVHEVVALGVIRLDPAAAERLVELG